MVFNTRPVPKPRMTRRDKWLQRPTVMRYRSFKDDINLQANVAGYCLPNEFKVTFGMPFPRSFGKVKRDKLVGTPHTQKPDVDNLLKALMDSLKDQDQDVWHVEARKVWAYGDGFVLVEDFNNEEISQ